MPDSIALASQQSLPEDTGDWLCNVVWGGNQLVLERFSTPGLAGYLLSVPCANRPVGGDIYHVTVCDRGVFSKFLLADVAGHGDTAAGISSRLQEPLFRLMGSLDNSALLEELNGIIYAEEAAGSFATATIATYNHWDHSWLYAYAGHPFMLIRRDGRWQALPECCSAPPAGVLVDSRYYQNEIRLRDDDWLFMFSDAVYEIRQADGGRLGMQGLVQLLDSIDNDDISGFYHEMMQALVAHNGSQEFDDDLTLILLKRKQPRRTLHAQMFSMARRFLMRWMKRKEKHCRTEPASIAGTSM